MFEEGVTYSVHLCVVIDKKGGELRVIPPVIRSGNEDAAFQPDGVAVKRAVGGSLDDTTDNVALLIDAKVEELGGP